MTSLNDNKLFGCVFCEFTSPHKGSVKSHVQLSCKYKYINTRDETNPNFFKMVDRNIYLGNIQNFIKSKIIKIDEKRVSRKLLFKSYQDMFPSCKIKTREFISYLEKEGINYSPYINKGSFLNIQLQEIVANDKNIHDFVKSKIIKIDGTSIGKNRFFDEYKKMFPECQFNIREFIEYIKKERIVYTPYARCDGNEGCFVNIKFNDVVE